MGRAPIGEGLSSSRQRPRLVDRGTHFTRMAATIEEAMAMRFTSDEV